MQAASCIDASQGFAGNLTISNSVFANNGFLASSASPANSPPVAVNCSGGTSLVSCSISVQDSLFDSNSGQEALGMGVACVTSLLQSCNFEFMRTNFTNHQLLGDGTSYTFPYYSPASTAGYHQVDTTAAALVVKALAVGNNTASSFSLYVLSCNFAANSGAGLWVLQERNDAVTSPLISGEVTIFGSSFIGHLDLFGGMPALAIFGARSVFLKDSVWQGNSLGAAALELVQDLVTIDSVTVSDNLANSITFSSFDIYMMDADVSTVSISGSMFTNNTGVSYLPPTSISYTAAGAVNCGSHNSKGSVSVSLVDTSFKNNHGYLSPGAFVVLTALQLNVKGACEESDPAADKPNVTQETLFLGEHGNSYTCGSAANQYITLLKVHSQLGTIGWKRSTQIS